MEFVKVEDGMQIGQPLTFTGGSTETGKSMINIIDDEIGKSMINIIVEESRLVNAQPTTSDFENEVLHEIVDYIMNTPSTRGMDMRDAIQQFWNEKLN